MHDAPNQPNTCVDFVLSGDHDRMTEIAFGKPMDFDWHEDNSSITLANDPDHPGYKQIETLALEYYEFLCKKFGEENVLGLECYILLANIICCHSIRFYILRLTMSSTR